MLKRIVNLCAALLIGPVWAAGAATATTDPEMRIRHVFIIVLENKDFDDTFRTSIQDAYLQKTLPKMGALLTQYYGTGHASLDNYISIISGQGSSVATEGDCMDYSDFKLTGLDSDGQAIGTGCVYPGQIKTLADQLTAAGWSWKGYMEDMGNDPAREKATCGHAALNTKDLTQSPQAPSASVPAGDQHAARHNPFVYFHSIIDSPECDKRVVNLNRLTGDLKSVKTTPNLTFITPNLCNDGHDGDGTGAPGKGCVNGEPGGLASSDAFLRIWVPRILSSPAYRKDGLLVVTFDEGNVSVLESTTSVSAGGKKKLVGLFKGNHCCNQKIGPNITRPYAETFAISPTEEFTLKMEGYGGDRIGTVLLSPLIKPGTVSDVPYNHYALLRSIEDLFHLDHLGYAGQSGLAAFGGDVFSP